MMTEVRYGLMLVALGAFGCGSDDDGAAVVPSRAGCAAGEWLRDDGVCVAAGLPPDMPCAPSEWLRSDGVCVPAGVPPDGCGAGFVHDGDRGCDPILPAPCAPGLMAVPGDPTCHEVLPCAAGTWGDIPVEADTEYVDASYAGMDSDGSALKPWTTVQGGVDAASSGAIVAIAEGSYPEDVTVDGKAVRLWGVCPARVEVVATGAKLGGVRVLGASGTQVRGLAVRGDSDGFVISGSLDVELASLWVHDTKDRGIDIESAYGPTGVTLRASLVEQSHEIGVYVSGSELTVEASVVRDTQPDAIGLDGRGVGAEADPFATPSHLVLKSSLLERNREHGLFVAASDAKVEASVVRDTQPDTQGHFGRGVHLQADPTTGVPSTFLMQASLVELNHENGVFVGVSEAIVEASVVRDTQPDALGTFGRGVSVQGHPTTGVPSTLLLDASLVEQSHDAGVFVAGSEATVKASVVRDTQPDAQGLLGRGVEVLAHPMTGVPSQFVMQASLVERSYSTGVLGSGSEVTVEASVVRDTQPDAQGLYGRGVNVQADPITNAASTLLLQASVVELCHEAGVAILGSVGTVDACLLRDSRASPAQGAGDGVMVVSEPGLASATITATRIEQSALAAVAAWGARAAVGGSALSCQMIDLDSESYRGIAAELDDLGLNACGCSEPIASCKASSTGLAPPSPLAPAAE